MEERIQIIKAKEALKMYLPMIQMNKIPKKITHKIKDNLTINKTKIMDFSRNSLNLRVYQT